jgi:hypothetical protein
MKKKAGKLAFFFWALTLLAATLFLPQTTFASASPSITTQPQSQSVRAGLNASFSVVAGGQTPLGYQWTLNGTNLVNSAHIGGATGTTLTINNIGASDAGNYQVVVSNSHGMATSSNARLTVLFPAATTQPANQAVLLGGNAGLTVAISGTPPLVCQWYFDGSPLTDGGRVSGSATTNLNIANVQTNDAGSYRLVVTNNYGSATSSVATLTVLVPAFIVSQPTNQVVFLTSNLSFTVTAGGTAPVCQWYFNGTPLTDGGRVIGSATTSLNIANAQTNDTGSYQVMVTNSYGSATSSIATLTVLVPVTITTQPANQSAEFGANAIFSVVATGLAPLNYQWTFNGTDIPGATNAVLMLAGLQASQAGNYAVQASNVYGSLLSSSAALTVNLPPPGVPFITGISPNTAVQGATVTILGTNFSATAASNVVYFGAVQANVMSASPASLTVTVPVGATFAPVTVTVNGLTAYAGERFLPTFVGAGQIDSSSLGPQLVLPAGNGTGQMIIGDLDGDGKPDLITASGSGNTIIIYRNISTNGSLTTASFAPPITLAPPVSGAPYGVALADVDGDGKLDIIATDNGANLISIFRNISTPGSISSNSFATRVDFATGAQPQGVAAADLDGDGRPDVVVANTGDGTVSILHNTSTVGNIAFAPKVDIATGGVCCGVAVGDLDGDGELDVVAVNAGDNTMSLLRNVSSPGNISFAATVNFSIGYYPIHVAIGDLDGDGKPDLTVTYYLGQILGVFRNTSTAGSLTTNSFAPEIDFALGGRGHTGAIADLDGDGKPDVAVVTELNSLLSIFKNVSTPGSFTDSSLAGRVDFSTGYNASGVAIGDLDGDGRPDMVFANSYDSTISIYQNQSPVGGPPVILASPGNQSVLFNATAQLAGNAVGLSPLNYQWFFNGTNLVDNGRIVGSTTGSLIISNTQAADAGNYYFVVTNSLGSATSAVASLTLLFPPVFTQQPSNQAVLLNSNAAFEVAVNGTTPFGFQWFFNGTRLSDNGHIFGSMTTNLTIANVQTADVGNYTVLVTNVAGSVTSTVAALFFANPIIASQPQSQSVLAGATVTFNVSATGQQPLAYQWLLNGGAITGATNSSLVLPNVQVNQSGSYSVLVTNTYGSASSSNATLNVAAFSITTQPTNRVTWLNGSASFRVNVSGYGPFTYEWLLNGQDFGGPNSNVLLLTNVQAWQFGAYSVVISNPYGYLTSSNAVLFPSQVAVWGNYYGETNLPAGLINIIAISGGLLSPMDCQALNSNGTVVTWPSAPPTNVTASVTNLIAISCGGEQGNSLGLRPDGSVISWYLKPATPVAGLTNIVAIAVDGGLYLALTTNGTVRTPATVAPPSAATNVVAVALRNGHDLALKADGTVIAWGNNSYGQSTVPAGLSNIIAIAAGYYHSLALKNDGTVTGWGNNANGQITVPAGLSNVVAIAAGGYHSLALTASGSVVAWGLNSQGQTNVPPGLANVVAISAGMYHSLALIGSGPPVLQPVAANPSLGTNGFSFILPSQSGKVYVLQSKGSLSDSNWTSTPLVPGNGGTLLLSDQSATNNSQGFYRVQRW